MKLQSLYRALFALFVPHVAAQSYYQDYGDDQQQDYYGQEEGDTLYHDYAAHQQIKAQGGGGG